MLLSKTRTCIHGAKNFTTAITRKASTEEAQARYREGVENVYTSRIFLIILVVDYYSLESRLFLA